MDPSVNLSGAPHLLERILAFLEYPQVERCRLVSKRWQSATDEYLRQFGEHLRLNHLMKVWSDKEPQTMEMKGEKK